MKRKSYRWILTLLVICIAIGLSRTVAHWELPLASSIAHKTTAMITPSLPDEVPSSVMPIVPKFRRIVSPADGETFSSLRQRLVAVDAEVLGWGGDGYDTRITQEALDTLVQGGATVAETPLPITPMLRDALQTQSEVEATLVFTTFEEAEAIAQRFGAIALRDAVTFTASSAEVMELLETSTTILAGDIVMAATLCNATARSDTYLGVDTLQLNQTRLMGEGEIIGVMDTGCSVGINTWETSAHPGLKDQILRLSPQPWNWVSPGTCKDNSGHGTHVVGSIVGTGAGGENNMYRGVAPGAKVFFQNASSNGSGTLNLIPALLDCVFDDAYASGARIHSNSWGVPNNKMPSRLAPPAYNLMAWSMDRYTWDHQDFLPLFAAGNYCTDLDADGTLDLMTMGSFTVTAKNILVVGGADKDSNGYKLAKFSDTGPLSDGRLKPDVITPAVNITSTNINSGYRTESGTSMATPLTAGACAIIRQYCREELGIEAPSSPLVRALLISGCENIVEDMPNGYEGFGLTSVTRSLTPETGKPMTKTFAYDEATEEVYTVNVTAEGRLRATLVWLDAPAPLWSMSGLVNDLDLSITNLTTGETLSLDDHVNVIERIDLNVTPGRYAVTVKAKSVPIEGGSAALVLNVPSATPVPSIQKITPKEESTNTVTLTINTKNGTTLLRRETLQVHPGEELTLHAKTLNVPAITNATLQNKLHTPETWSLSTGDAGSGTVATFTVPEINCTLTWTTDGGVAANYCEVGLLRVKDNIGYGGSVFVLPGATYTFPILTPGSYWRFSFDPEQTYPGGVVVADITESFDALIYVDEDYNTTEDTSKPVILILRDPPVESPVNGKSEKGYLAAIQVYDDAAYDPNSKVTYPLSQIALQRRLKGTNKWESTPATYPTEVYVKPLGLMTEYRFGVTDGRGQEHMVWSDIFELECLSSLMNATFHGNTLSITNDGTLPLDVTITRFVNWSTQLGSAEKVTEIAPGETITRTIDFEGKVNGCSVSVKPTNAIFNTGGVNFPYNPEPPGYHFRLK